MGFEEANLPDIPRGEYGTTADVTNAIPHWNLYGKSELDSEETLLSSIRHNTFVLGYAFSIIYDTNWTLGTVLDGKYSLLVSGAPGFQMALGQKGQVPEGARWLLFNARTRSINIRFAGEPLPFTRVEVLGRYDTYGVDISRFAGKEGELRFIAENERQGASLDNIRFSDSSPPPMLWMKRTPEGPKLFWPLWSAEEGYRLQSKGSITGEWADVGEEPLIEEGLFTLVFSGTGDGQIYRLRKE